jgi:hypothetical protein
MAMAAAKAADITVGDLIKRGYANGAAHHGHPADAL